jgi:hypothetical protein
VYPSETETSTLSLHDPVAKIPEYKVCAVAIEAAPVTASTANA